MNVEYSVSIYDQTPEYTSKDGLSLRMTINSIILDLFLSFIILSPLCLLGCFNRVMFFF